MAALTELFRPGRIGRLALRNRLVMSPMENQYGTPDGLPSARTIAYLEARARGGVGLITLGASSVDGRHKEVPNSLHFGDDAVVAPHRELVDRIHAAGAAVQPQLCHAGPDGLAPEIHGIDALGPSAIQSYLTGTTSREIGEADWRAILDAYRAAAVRVREAGYDGIELHAAHGYMLLGSYVTPWRNARRDGYSARARETRIRAVVEAVDVIKRETGREFPLTLRISGFERVAGGRPSDDTARLAPALAEAGVDAFHVSGGVIDRLVTRMVNGAHDPDGLNVAAAAAVKRAVDVPVLVVGRIHDPVRAERILSEGSADFIVMGRPLLADPELPAKARSGRLAEIRRCISCQNCIDAMETRLSMDCAVNPLTGRERELSLTPAAEPKRVLVIGGGPGGLEAARVAAARGHDVTLLERSRRLGGAFGLACTVHPENQPFLDFLQREVKRLGVRIELGTPATADAVAGRGADAVIVATGGRLVTPPVPGDDLPHVWSGARLRALLAGSGEGTASPWLRLGSRLAGLAEPLLGPSVLRHATRLGTPLGRRVVIVGGDLAALELAEFLAARRHRVSVLEPGDELAPEVGPKRRMEHLERLDRAGVPVNTGLAVARITPSALIAARPDGGEVPILADTVILAGAVQADTTFYDALVERGVPAQAVGDCTGLGLVQKATSDAARAACAL